MNRIVTATKFYTRENMVKNFVESYVPRSTYIMFRILKKSTHFIDDEPVLKLCVFTTYIIMESYFRSAEFSKPLFSLY